jgi:serine/threonine protein kinase
MAFDSLDLGPYGIRAKLYPTKESLDSLSRSKIATMVDVTYDNLAIKSATLIDLNGTLHKLRTEKCVPLGKGEYGSVCLLQMHGKLYAVKEMDINRYQPLENIINEMLINIILFKIESKYIAEFSYFALSENKKKAYFITEMLDGSIESYLTKEIRDSEDSEVLVPILLLRIARILEIYKAVNFIHRDLHTENILYNAYEGGKYIFKLIDFGKACIVWKGLVINSDPDSPRCFIEGANITFILTAMLRIGFENFSDDLKNFFRERYLQFNTARGPVNMIKDRTPHQSVYVDSINIPLSYDRLKLDMIDLLESVVRSRIPGGNKLKINLAKEALKIAKDMP